MNISDFGVHLVGPPNAKANTFNQDVKALIEKGPYAVIMADSLEELAARTGIDLDGLLNTVEEYNKACETGRDDALNKKARYLRPVKQPKFYASLSSYNLGTLAGIKTKLFLVFTLLVLTPLVIYTGMSM